jgi:thiol:disulfide interchange protein DsbD
MKKLVLAIALYQIASSAYANPISTPSTSSATAGTVLAVPATGQLLEPERAFQPRIRRKDAKTAEVKFDIAPGYYLYQGRIRVEGYSAAALSPPTERVTASQASKAAGRVMAIRLPQGRFVDDPTFGHVEIFDRSVSFDVDLDFAPTGGAEGVGIGTGIGKGKGRQAIKSAAKLVVTSQGCAAAGVCFPPLQHEFSLPAAASFSQADAATENPWVLPVGATALGFGRPKSFTGR